MSTSTCPGPAAVSRFLLGELPDDEAELVETHLAACTTCQVIASKVVADNTLVRAMKAQTATLPGAEGEAVDALVARLSGLIAMLAKSDAATFAAEETTDSSLQAVEESYDFLSPAEAEGELGRLGSYRVLRVLGIGGMGIVFEAEDPRLRRRVALKIMKPSFAASSDHRQRFLREARAAAAVEHDHVVPIHQVDEANGVPFLAMPLLKGESLDDLLQRSPGPMPVLDVIRIVRQAAEGLDAAHRQGLVHRDVKPANLFLERTGLDPEAPSRVKILDFGLARLSDPDSHLTRTGVVAGTPQFMAPEQARAEETDARADLFSLGGVLYRMTTGLLPFPGSNTLAVLHALANDVPKPPHLVNPAVPQSLSDLTMHLLEKDRERRPASAREVVRAVAAIESDLTRPTDRPRRRKRIVAAVVALLAIIAAVALAASPGVHRFATNQGVLIVETDDPDVEVSVRQNGEQVRIVDAKSGHTVEMKAGTYELVITKGKAGLTLTTNEFTLHRGDKEIVRVRYEPAAVSHAAPAAKSLESATIPAATPAVPASRSPTTSELLVFDKLRKDAYSVAFSPDNRWLIVGSGHRLIDGKIDISDPTFPMLAYDLSAPTMPPRSVNHSNMVRSLDFAANRRDVLAAAWDGPVLEWDPETGRVIRQHKVPGGGQASAAYAPERRWVLFGGVAGVVRLWDLDRQRTILEMKVHNGRVNRVDFSPDRSRALSVGVGRAAAEQPSEKPDLGVLVWDLTTGQQLHRLDHDRRVSSAVFLPDGRRILSSSQNEPELRLWDLETGKELRRFVGHDSGVNALAISPDGQFALSAGHDRTVRLWDVESGRLIQTFRGHTAVPYCVAFSPDGRMAASGGLDRSVRVWPLPPEVGRQFVLSARDGQGDRRYATLLEAIAAAPNKGVIEVRGDGPFACPQISIGKKDLTIRAGPGRRPVLTPADPAQPAFLGTIGDLNLEGLEFRATGTVPDPPVYGLFVYTSGARLRATHCRFDFGARTDWKAIATHPQQTSHFEMRNSEIVACDRDVKQIGWIAPPIIWLPPETGRMILDNNLIACKDNRWAVELRHRGTIRDIRVQLARNTLIGQAMRLVLDTLPPADLMRPPIQLTAVRNVFDCPAIVLGLHQAQTQPNEWRKPDARLLTVAEAEKTLGRLMAWSDDGNLYSPVASLLRFTTPDTIQTPTREQRTLADWHEFWKTSDPKSRQETLRYVLDWASTKDRDITAENFRLHPEMKTDAGADVGSVGPGPAYERWKRTEGYRAWLGDGEKK